MVSIQLEFDYFMRMQTNKQINKQINLRDEKETIMEKTFLHGLNGLPHLPPTICLVFQENLPSQFPLLFPPL